MSHRRYLVLYSIWITFFYLVIAPYLIVLK